MTRTQQLLVEHRERERQRANALQAALSGVLAQLNEPENARIRAALKQLTDTHIALLDKGIAEGIISEKDYRRLMGGHLDQIDLTDLLQALA